MALRFLQANINHSARAQDLMIQSMAEWLINIAVVSEPYSIPRKDNWVGDIEGLVCITRQGGGFSKIMKGSGWVSALVESVMVVAVYFSPNRPIHEFERFLVDLGAAVGRCHPYPVLVIGDLNAKSALWGSPVTNPKGVALEEWILSIGLQVVNRGSISTCVRLQGESIVDITFASPNLARRIRGWEVLAEVETLSDHRYIRFDIALLPRLQSGYDTTSSREDSPRWSLKQLDRAALEEASIVQAWVAEPSEPSEIIVHDEVNWLTQALTQVCDAAMPRVRSHPAKCQVYWWSIELAALREACVVARRQYARHRRRRLRDLQLEERLYETYRAAKTDLQLAIAEAKSASHDEFLESLNRDPWGRPYRMVRGKLRPWAPPLTQTLEPRFLQSVVSSLFPTREEHIPPQMAVAREGSEPEESGAEVPPVNEVEMKMAVMRLKAKKTAPGLDGIPGRALALALKALGQRLQGLFDACFLQGCFPTQWKAGKLVLLKKEGRPLDSPAAYRPIVLLDDMGKLLERIIADRLIGHLNCIGPNLDENQFGFRRGRSTIGAILRVKNMAEEAVSQGEVFLAVSLDIANAFNTLPWSCIREALKYHKAPTYLCRILEDYLHQRVISFKDESGWRRHEMTCGVPQGSVLGPLLWNIGYDWVLRGAMLWGVSVTCYADDTLVTAKGKSYREAALLATAGVAQVVARIKRLGLEVALNKSEAVCFHGPRQKLPAEAHIVVGGVRIGVESTIKYLGLVLDSRWNFNAHFQRLAPKLTKSAVALSGLLPNLKGAAVSCRRLYMGVVRSMALYGAPVWAGALNSQNIALLRNPQRAMALRVIRGYRTVSFEAACVLAGAMPWDLEARGLTSVYMWREMEISRGHRLAPREVANHRLLSQGVLVEEWLTRLAQPTAGHRTVEAVRPVLKEWIKREKGSLTFHLTQVLTGHGCFAKYLCRIGREVATQCHHCDNPEDTAQHTLEICPAWASQRRELVTIVGNDLSLPALARAMVDSAECWEATTTFCEEVLSHKEAAEREREAVATDPIRRRRAGRRRRRFLQDLRPP